MPWWGWLLLGAGVAFAGYQVYRSVAESTRARGYKRTLRFVPRGLLASVATPLPPRSRGSRGPGVG